MFVVVDDDGDDDGDVYFGVGVTAVRLQVLMRLMPPKADKLTTEHIKSRLQKYRLHANRSKVRWSFCYVFFLFVVLSLFFLWSWYTLRVNQETKAVRATSVHQEGDPNFWNFLGMVRTSDD